MYIRENKFYFLLRCFLCILINFVIANYPNSNGKEQRYINVFFV